MDINGERENMNDVNTVHYLEQPEQSTQWAKKNVTKWRVERSDMIRSYAVWKCGTKLGQHQELYFK
jgi:hypothetical protein